VALGEPRRHTAVELMRNADVALYSAKDAGKGRAVLFEPHMHDRTRERTELSTDLVQAVERDELVMAYQPIVDLASGDLVGVEALVRWMHPERGVISPAVFVPLAEASGLIRPIGRWVLEQAARQQVAWREAFPARHPPSMEVNVSAAQLSDEALVEDILAIISATRIDPTSLVLEITESALVEDVDTALLRLGQLSATGVRIALDDFGTGYSSLSYLRRMPISILKIDRSFSGGIDEPGSQSAALMHSIVGLAGSLGMETIVEGIEHDAQVEALRGFGCLLGQGFLFSRPVPAAELTGLLRRGRQALPAQRRAP
jgi:EAL domain-containing protein (putative c-di-GMP-specific phosphodiesterase class I)